MVKTYILDCNRLANKLLYESVYSSMPEIRKEKTDSFRFDSDKRLSVGVGYLIKKYVGNEDEMYLGDNDKPLMNGAYFNASHSGNIAMLSVAQSDVGCDVELIKSGNLMRIADRFFFNNEYEMLKNETNEELQQELFFRLWTLKESFLKATGEGLRIPLNSFCVNPLSNPPTLEQSYNSLDYYCKEYKIKNYRLAVCCQGDNEFLENLIIDSF